MYFIRVFLLKRIIYDNIVLFFILLYLKMKDSVNVLQNPSFLGKKRKAVI